MEIASLILSTVAVAISAGSWWSSHKIAARQFALEESSARLATKQLSAMEQSEKLQSKAKLDAEFLKEDENYFLVITNRGGADARNVLFGFDGKGYPFIQSEVAAMFPLKTLRAGKSVRLIAAFDLDSDRHYRIDLGWGNPDNSSGHEKIVAHW